MKMLNQYIMEKFQVGNDYKRQYSYTPKNKYELITYIKEKIEQYGLGTKDNPLDLNDIDTSKIVDMSFLFSTAMGGNLISLSKKGHFDIADWNVSNVETTVSMFKGSNFNGDISDWDVRNVKNVRCMFEESKFDGDLSGWDVGNVIDVQWMFANSKFTSKNGSISNWNTKSVRYMDFMFFESKFNGNISKWDTTNVKSVTDMFTNCPLENNPPKWYHDYE